jgi:uncharacterized protein YggL (DUF469 family)
MNRRLRKKKHLREYRQLGFSLACDFHPGLSDEGLDAFVDAFLEEAVVPRDLLFGGSGNVAEWNGTIAAEGRYESVSEENRAGVEAWLKARKEISAARVSPLWDLWHGDDPLDE